MTNFNGILICTDLDGTLLRSDKTISDENKNLFLGENARLFYGFADIPTPEKIKNMVED